MKKIIGSLVVAGALFAATPALAHEVKPGDTMGKIASANSLSLNQLASMNPQVQNINLIYPGQTIKTEGGQTAVQPTQKTPQVTNSVAQNEKDLLARLVRAEAESEPYAGKVAVAWVVLNRVDSPEFPNSISAVINQPGQFSPVSNGTINRAADSESVRAVEEALRSDRSRGAGSLFFYNPKTATSRWLDSRPTTIVIGNHVFKK